MKIINSLRNLRPFIADLRCNDHPIALVPTMGALHAGHLALVSAAKAVTPNVIVSIFVNPTQFGAGEDLDNYPQQLKEDAALLKALDVCAIWAPDTQEIYPDGFATSMQIAGLDDNFCGAKRPGHFDGVILIVSKLFNQTGADLAFFGEKDYQQLAIIRQMAVDLDFDIDIIGVPTVRNDDGLALSSRNAYLSADELENAIALPQSLHDAAIAIKDGKDVERALSDARDLMLRSGFQKVDYIDLIDAKSLKPIKKWHGEDARLLAAAFIGTTRLIDNISIK